MYIKDLEKAETLPYRLSIRKSSDYDSWDSYHVCGRGYYTWFQRFLEKHTDEPFGKVFSLLKERLKKKRANPEDSDGLIRYFLDEVLYSQKYHWYRYYVDDNGIIRYIPRDRKNRDKILKFGEPVIRYFFKEDCKNFIPVLIALYGYEWTYRALEQGISLNEYCSKNNYPWKFNEACMRRGCKPLDWGGDYWYDLWRRIEEYPYVERLDYHSPEWWKYHYEVVDAQRKHDRERKREKIDKFNQCESCQEGHKPILIG